ncbi:hypothetical protein ARMGADRAFT_1019739 [Armillaria gallica]|uniref:Uncharacterized protein n=1 Tax=Armillaria gallica TaxID=47427 RepID=A0A2H3CZU7_ARMGA|nr:hypothetical protein ARMGADRAFT_1019739 [Armillaria gallica]
MYIFRQRFDPKLVGFAHSFVLARGLTYLYAPIHFEYMNIRVLLMPPSYLSIRWISRTNCSHTLHTSPIPMPSAHSFSQRNASSITQLVIFFGETPLSPLAPTRNANQPSFPSIVGA